MPCLLSSTDTATSRLLPLTPVGLPTTPITPTSLSQSSVQTINKVVSSLTRVIFIADFTIFSRLLGLFALWQNPRHAVHGHCQTATTASSKSLISSLPLSLLLTLPRWAVQLERVDFGPSCNICQRADGVHARFRPAYHSPVVVRLCRNHQNSHLRAYLPLREPIVHFLQFISLISSPSSWCKRCYPRPPQPSHSLLPATPSPHASLPAESWSRALRVGFSICQTHSFTRRRPWRDPVVGGNFVPSVPLFVMARYALEGLEWLEAALLRETAARPAGRSQGAHGQARILVSRCTHCPLCTCIS